MAGDWGTVVVVGAAVVAAAGAAVVEMGVSEEAPSMDFVMQHLLSHWGSLLGSLESLGVVESSAVAVTETCLPLDCLNTAQNHKSNRKHKAFKIIKKFGNKTPCRKQSTFDIETK